MKKMKRLLTIGLAVLFMLCMCFCLTGCNVEPYHLDTWYLGSYVDENGNRHTAGYDNITATHLYSDDITIRYFENKTFIFKEFDKEFTGTYTYKNGCKGKTSVSLTFSDGSKGTGTCAQYMFDGTWYEGTLQAFGKEYNFSGEWEERYGKATQSYMQVGNNILYMLKNGETKNSFRGYSTLYKGIVELRGDGYWFVPCNLEDINEQNLSQAYELYTYEVAGDYSVQRGDNTLREGECFINHSFYEVALDSENFETRDRYAVWYYQDPFKKIYPWTLDLEQEDILSVRAEFRENDSLSFYRTHIWEQGSEQLQEFYELFLNSNIVGNVPPLVGVTSTMTYYIKVADQTYTVVWQDGWTENDDFCQGFVVDGCFYRIYAEKRLDTTYRLDGNTYLAM